MWREQAETEGARRAISVVACCHSVKLCAFAAHAFQSQQSGVVHCKKEGVLLQPLSWCSSHASATAICEQRRSKQGEGKDQASDTYK